MGNFKYFIVILAIVFGAFYYLVDQKLHHSSVTIESEKNHCVDMCALINDICEKSAESNRLAEPENAPYCESASKLCLSSCQEKGQFNWLPLPAPPPMHLPEGGIGPEISIR